MNRVLRATVFFSLFFVVLLLFLLINITGIDLIFRETVYPFFFLFTFIGIISLGLNVYILSLYGRYKINEHKRKESNIREYHRYHELFDPTIMDT